MISQAVYNVAAAQAGGLLASINKKVMPGSQSLINQLINSSYVSSSSQNVAQAVEEVTGDHSGAISIHTGGAGAIIDELAPVVQSHIEFIQNTVSSKVEEMYGLLEEFKKESTRLGPASLFNLRVQAVPPSLSNESIRGMIENFAQDGQKAPGQILSLPAMSYEQLIELMSVSNTYADKEVKEWLSVKGHDWLLNIWNYFFASQNTPKVKGADLIQYRDGLEGVAALPSGTRLELSTALFLLSRALYSAPLEDTDTGMSLAQWRSSMDAYSRYAAVIFKQSARLIEGSVRNKMLVLGVSDEGRTVTVLGPVYSDWLAEGNSIETILGAAISGRSNTYSVQDLQGEINFTAIWSNFETTEEASMRLRVGSMMRAHALGAMGKVCNKFTDEEIEYFGGSQSLYENMARPAAQWLQEVSNDTVMDTYGVALKLVAGIRYRHTPAYQFMTDMLEMRKHGCEDVREAAAVAAINYIADYLSSELVLVQA